LLVVRSLLRLWYDQLTGGPISAIATKVRLKKNG